MANTLGIVEVALADIVKKDNAVNLVGTGGRTSVLKSLVVRLLAHNDDSGVADETDADAMALFESKAFGHPWIKQGSSQRRLVFESPADGLTPCPADATYIVPNIDYTTFG